jgi:hypothetical protein
MNKIMLKNTLKMGYTKKIPKKYQKNLKKSAKFSSKCYKKIK